MKKATILLFVIIILTSCKAVEPKIDNSKNEESRTVETKAIESKTEISGNLEDGLRVLDMNKQSNLLFTVFRGDYIVVNLDKDETSSLLIPGLDIDEKLPKEKSETQYIKIKKSGVFNFTLGERNGVLTVLELTAPNYKEVTAQEALKLIENINPLIIDVRTQGEYASGHIENASLLPVQVLSSNLDKLEEFKDEPIFLYCQSGNRSTVAAKILIDNGFSIIYNLRYGIGDWKRAGLPVIK